MLKLKQHISEIISEYIDKLYDSADSSSDEIARMFEYPPDTTLGDIALPCFKFSKALKKAPPVIASAIAAAVSDDIGDNRINLYIGAVQAVGGYINIKISEKYLGSCVIPEIEAKGDDYGKMTFGSGKTVVLDYSSPNVAKPFHLGHLGTTVIGHSLKLLHEFAGYECVGINYLGDWGTSFGKLIVAYRKWGVREKIEDGGIDEITALYVKFHKETETDESLLDQARYEFAQLEQGNEDNIALWKWFIEVSLAEYEKTYKQIGITFDSYKGESFYTDKMPAQVERLRELNLLKIDNGASIVDLEEYGMPPCLILKTDGSTLYPTRDIAAAVYRKETYNFDKAIYVTAASQNLHFAQWMKVIELMGHEWYSQLVHVPYGTMSINGEKLATRTGNVVLLKDLFATMIERVHDIIEQKNPSLPNKDETAEAVGVGAVIFYYLSNNKIKDINFIMEDALSFDGNTGPYAQYTYARTCSIMEKAKAANVSVTGGEMKFTAPEETELVKTLCRFGEKVTAAINEYEPSVVTRFIIDICTAFNRFYNECPILSADSPEVRETRLRLCMAVKVTLGNALTLICMKKPEKI